MIAPILRVTDLYCEGIPAPIPYPGRPHEFEALREAARAKAASTPLGQSRSMVLRWKLDDGSDVVIDLDRAKIVAMVERVIS